MRTRNSIRGFVRPSVRPSARVKKWENKRFRTFLVANSCISAPAHPSTTDGHVSGLVSLLQNSRAWTNSITDAFYPHLHDSFSFFSSFVCLLVYVLVWFCARNSKTRYVCWFYVGPSVTLGYFGVCKRFLHYCYCPKSYTK